MAVVLSSGESFLSRILLLLSKSACWLDDVIMTLPALLTDVLLTSLELLATVAGAALIGLGAVNFIFFTVSPNFNSFVLVLPNPTPYSESESLSSYQHFCVFLLDFFNAFSNFLIFLLNCAKFKFTGFAFLPTFLAARKSDFSFPSCSNLQQS